MSVYDKFLSAFKPLSVFDKQMSVLDKRLGRLLAKFVIIIIGLLLPKILNTLNLKHIITILPIGVWGLDILGVGYFEFGYFECWIF